MLVKVAIGQKDIPAIVLQAPKKKKSASKCVKQKLVGCHNNKNK